MNTKENLDAHQTLIDGLKDLISGKISAGMFARRSGLYATGLTLKVIQTEILRGLKESVHAHHDNRVPALISPDLALEFRETLFSVYFSIGMFV